ncbi:TlpA family protein disulfide reductase [Carboxylicivirga caseinilyticus]|uniref:TlpA family protein disulfide reductase n=1 Tax=Carboxylicivirga caseinilyticus TaxID=3417572 RepID=UPI003D3416AA
MSFVKIAFDKNKVIPRYLYCKEDIDDANYHVIKVHFSNFKATKYDDKILSIESVPKNYSWGLKKHKLAIEHIAPEFKLPQIDGDSISLNCLKGNYILLNFGFIGCGPCHKSIPILNEIQNEYKPYNLKVVGVNLKCSNPQKIKEYKDLNNIQYTLLWSSDLEIEKKYKINSAPTVYLIDSADMKIIYSSNGFKEDQLKEKLKEIFGI